MLGITPGGPLGERPVGGPDDVDASPPGRAREDAGGRSASERDAWAVLGSVEGLGPVAFTSLLARFGTADAVLDASLTSAGRAEIARLDSAAEVPPPLAHRFEALGPAIARAASERDARLAPLRELGLAVLTLDDEAYPARLRAIELPPPVLYVRGDPRVLGLAHAVAVVGTRRPTGAGRRVAARIAAAVAVEGGVVVSGLAVGIDGAAHAAVVAEARPTVAVLGGGHGHLYPGAHAGLATAIVATGGALVSEMPPTTEPTAGLFPRRNRLISGLADATVVVEAGERSGALITASWALEQGRECFLVPGPIDAPLSAGCLAFLRSFPGAARIVAGVPQLLEDLGLVEAGGEPSGAPGKGTGNRSRRASPRSPGRPTLAGLLAELGETERTVARRLVAGDATVDDLVAASGEPVATLLGALTLLEMRGYATSAYGRYRPAGRLASMDPERRRRRAPAT